MRELKVLDGGHLNLSRRERKAFFEEELGERTRGYVKRLLEEALEAERTDWLGVGRYVRDEAGRRDYRNGYYRRDLGTRLGRLCGLRVPRTRGGCRSQLLKRYQRRQEPVNELVRQAFLRGISTRQVGEVLEPVLGEAYSAQTVSRITRSLDRAVEAYHRRRLGDEYVYLFLDGIVLKVRDPGGTVRRRVVLVAYGITRHGRRELIGYRLAQGESEAAWTAFLQDFFLRGFEGRLLRLIITDGSKGLKAALGLVYPRVPQQRCWAHKLRNIADKVPKKEGSCVREAAAIYQADSRREALAVYRAWAEKWRRTRTRAVASLERDLEELLSFFAVPPAHWRKVRTTNVIERSFREVRRRTRPISSFTNPASCDRIIFGVVSHLNRSWERKPLRLFTQNT
ncbi:MAG TPA: IS256 family transposase [Candidatus Acidoferrales bacterium]|nr:IS256 family transposase [Candidatus Acidoferrales bacterium]